MVSGRAILAAMDRGGKLVHRVMSSTMQQKLGSPPCGSRGRHAASLPFLAAMADQRDLHHTHAFTCRWPHIFGGFTSNVDSIFFLHGSEVEDLVDDRLVPRVSTKTGAYPPATSRVAQSRALLLLPLGSMAGQEKEKKHHHRDEKEADADLIYGDRKLVAASGLL